MNLLDRERRELRAVVVLERVLELIAKRSRALVDASAVAILLDDGEEFIVAAAAGEIPPGIVGSRVPKAASMAARVLASESPKRIDDLRSQLQFSLRDRGVERTSGLFVPLRFRSMNVGVIEASDRIDGPEFRAEDERMLLAAAASAATAVATAQSVQRDRLRQAMRSAEQQRGRSARELHDQTLQGLGGLRLALAAAHRRRDLEVWQQTGEQAIEQIETEIANLRAIITDLRPPALDEFGLAAALDTLIARTRARHDIEICADIGLDSDGGDHVRSGQELEATAYRLVQEALNNAVTHAEPQRIDVRLMQPDSELEIVVRDASNGFDPDAIASGFGLTGMRERVLLAGGHLEITSSEHGTAIPRDAPGHR